MADSLPFLSATFDDRYIIDRELGGGGMAVVYLARDQKLDREVALKVLRPELGAVLGAERFLLEIKISARLDHPHILTLIDSGNAGGFLYYVLPYVRGESLRAKLDRERQLGIGEALGIVKQVASALDYAHRQGLVHRDIKPENILLQEGEAMLTDFGIALAVKEAGGNRLTETGLSLGTPQYMSPEQATGDRNIDARSDVYSLAAVLYEMLGGEPPVSGASAQAMIAKLMTEKPTRLRVLRDSIPLAIDMAVAQALSKTPADRFATAGGFARALEMPTVSESAAMTRPLAGHRMKYAAIAVAVAIVGIGAAAASGKFTKHDGAVVLGDKTQLTVSGAALSPAISADGKQLAYLTKRCATGGCTFSVVVQDVVQDVGGSTSRTILEGATSGYDLQWSPDRRNIVFFGTIDRRPGSWLLSTLGASPRFLGSGFATFFADGDSLLLGPPIRSDSVYWIRVAALDGVIRDSIRVAGPGHGLTTISVVPGTSWIVTLVQQPPNGLWQVISRDGKVADQLVNGCMCGGIATSDAVWLQGPGFGSGQYIVRITIDRSTGRLAARQDTIVTGQFVRFSVTGDGTAMVKDEGTSDVRVWALEMADLLDGRFPNDRRIAQASSGVSARVSPDGARLLIRRMIPLAAGRAEWRYTVKPFVGGQETTLGGVGIPGNAFWTDSVTVATSTRRERGLQLAQVDVRTGAQRNVLDLPDSPLVDFHALPDGWIWIPATVDRFVLRQAGRTREIPKPASYASVRHVAADPSGERVFYTGINTERDSLLIGVIAVREGVSTHWAATFGDNQFLVPGAGNETLTPLAEGTVLLQMAEATEAIAFFKLTGPNQIQRIEGPPRRLRGATVSRDLKRATAVEVEYRADAWLSKVVRPQ